MPIPILSLLYKCWEQDSIDRPSMAEINALAGLPEFPRLFDDLGGLKLSFSFFLSEIFHHPKNSFFLPLMFSYESS